MKVKRVDKVTAEMTPSEAERLREEIARVLALLGRIDGVVYPLALHDFQDVLLEAS